MMMNWLKEKIRNWLQVERDIYTIPEEERIIAWNKFVEESGTITYVEGIGWVESKSSVNTAQETRE